MKAVGQFKNEACLPSGSYSVFWLYLSGSLFSSSLSFYAKFFLHVWTAFTQSWWMIKSRHKYKANQFFAAKFKKQKKLFFWSFTHPRHSSVWPKWRLCHCRCFTCLQAFITVLLKPRKLGCFVTIKKLFIFHNHVFCHHLFAFFIG